MEIEKDIATNKIEEIEQRLDKLNAERSLLLKELRDLKETNNSYLPPLISRKLNFPTPNSPESKIELFKRLFCCREDLFPRFWENNKTGKKGYSPVCSNEWVKPICNKPKVKCSECSHQAFVPLDEISIKNHLQGVHILREPMPFAQIIPVFS